MGQRRPAHQPRVLRGPRSGVLAGDNAGLYPRRQRVRGSLSSALTAKTSLEERALAEPTGVLRRAPPQGGAAGRPPAGCGSDHRPCRGRQRLPGSAGACRCSGHALSPPRRQSWSGRDRTAAPRGRTCGPRLTRPKGTATAGPRPPAEEGAGGGAGRRAGTRRSPRPAIGTSTVPATGSVSAPQTHTDTHRGTEVPTGKPAAGRAGASLRARGAAAPGQPSGPSRLHAAGRQSSGVPGTGSPGPSPPRLGGARGSAEPVPGPGAAGGGPRPAAPPCAR